MDVELDFPSTSPLRPPPHHHMAPPGVPRYVSLPDSYRCAACQGVLREAVQTECGHRACAECVSQLLTENSQGGATCPAKEESCVILKEDKSHLSTCDYRPVPCQYVTSGCQAVISRRHKEDHVIQCDFRPAQCKHCGQTVTWKSLQSHEDVDCPDVVIPCPYSCGTEPRPRLQMKTHTERDCPKRPVPCDFECVGCTFTGTKEEKVRHREGSRDQHAHLTALHSRGVGQETDRCKEQIKDMKSTIQSLKDSLAEQSKHMALTIKAMDGLKRTLKEFQLKAVTQTERLITLERKMENMAEKGLVEKQRKDANMLKEQQESLERRVTLLERAGPTGGVGGAIQSQSQNDRRFALMDAQCAEMALRLQVIETANYSGVLMWKIRDYSKRKQEAKAGKTLSLYSQPFYTGQFGYKMCARVYLNGDGLGKGTHLSVFFVVQRGEYDALLPWPFRQKVTLMLLDQDTGTRHAVDSFKPDVSSSSFKRPETEMNVGSGCPLFISHVLVETPTYLKDDTIFIKVVVDLEGLTQS
ncbi:TNF receptor-associated factor 3-like isoform X2 [Crassostrea virginica]